MDRLEFIERHIVEIPKMTSIIYYLLKLPRRRKEAIAEAKEFWRLKVSMALHGPFDSKYYDDNFPDLLKDYDKIMNMFQENIEKDKTMEEQIKELQELNKSVAKE
jgi:hypothetical protein